MVLRGRGIPLRASVPFIPWLPGHVNAETLIDAVALDDIEFELAEGQTALTCKNWYPNSRTMSDDHAHRGMRIIAPPAPSPSSPAPSARR